jgi:protein O-GlcNAc transferase
MNAANSSLDHSAMTAAKDLIDNGDFVGADAIYRGLIENGCRDARVYCNYGLLRGLAGDVREQRELLERALVLNPVFPEAHLNLGIYYLQAGRSFQSIASFREATRLRPEMVEAYNNLGVALSNIGAFDEARSALDRAVALQPTYSAAWLNRCRLSIMCGHQALAEADYKQAKLLDPASSCLQRITAEALKTSGQIEVAIDHYKELLRDNTMDAELLIDYAECLRTLGRSDEAVEHYLGYIANDAGNPDVLTDFASALSDLGLRVDALSVLDQAILIKSDHVSALNLQGVLLQDLGLIDEAISRFKAAHLILPKHPAVLANLAAAHRYQGHLEDAIVCFKKAIDAEPTRTDLYQGLLFTYSIGGAELALPMLQAANQYWDLVRRNSIGTDNDTHFCPQERPAGRTRIGFLCAEIGEHVVSSFLSSFLRHYDRQEFEVELISVCRHYSERALMMVDLVDHAYSLQGLSLEAGRRVMRGRNYDVIIETSGFTRSTGIEYLAERCAPVQCHYIGYHASTGLDTIDYFIGDDEIAPDEFADQFLEKLWKLPRPWLAFHPFAPLPKAQALATKSIPALGSFNQFSKIREETLVFWAAALAQVPDSILVLKDRLAADNSICDRISQSLAKLGVDPVRIHFLEPTPGWEDHLQHYNLIDVALDATPWSSATTAVDALSMGVPLVAIRGQCTSARMSSSLVKGGGHPEWIAETPAEFGATVARLCSDLDSLRDGKLDRQQQMLHSPLMDQAGLADAVMSAISLMSKQAAIRPPVRNA